MVLLTILACSAGPSPRNPGLDAQRRVLHRAEESLLWRQAHSAWAAGDPTGAARAVAMGLEVAPDRFSPLVERAIAEGGPATVARFLERLDPARAQHLRTQAQELEVRARYAEGAVPEHAVGATQRQAQVVLAGVRSDFVTAPDEAAMRDGALTRLRWIAHAMSRPAPTADDVEGAIAAAIGAGIPEPIAAVEGVEGALGALDLHTHAVWPAQVAAWSEHHQGVRTGVGLVLTDLPGGTVVVERPTPDGPAWRENVHQGDIVVAVDGTPTHQADVASHLLYGASGTSVALTIARDGRAQTLELLREPVPEVTVHGWSRGPGNRWVLAPPAQPRTVFVRISAFRPSTDEAFDALLDGVTPDHVVLDLRGNRGGDVMAAANIADRFIGEGIVAALVGRTIEPPDLAEGEVAWNTALPGDALEGTPVTVLVDRDTASAAELLAGALRERAGARLIGEPTYGKAGSQALRTDDVAGVAWQVTTGTWTLPSGRSLHQGLQPDDSVLLSAAERYLVGVLRDQREHPTAHVDGSPMRYLGTIGRPELPRLAADPQLRAALAPLTKPRE